MKSPSKNIFLFVLFITFFLAGCGGESGTTNTVTENSSPVELPDYSTPLTGFAKPAFGDVITAGQEIVITFSNPMDTKTVLISGDLVAESDGGAWSTTTVLNDTLSFRPKTAWHPGNSRTLNISGNDLTGNAITLDSMYDVIDRVIYVSNSGNDNHTGSALQPKQTIQAALEMASREAFLAAEIRVAEGYYESSFQEGEALHLIDGVSIFGGYSSNDWAVRDPKHHETVIQETSSSDGMNYVLFANNTVGSNTRVDGLTLLAGNGGSSTAILLSGSSVSLSNLTIELGNPFFNAYGVFATNNAKAHIENISINTPTLDSDTAVIGIRLEDSPVMLSGSTITHTPAQETNQSVSAIEIDMPAGALSPVIVRNKIVLKGAQTSGIDMLLNSSASIVANHIEAGKLSVVLGNRSTLINNVLIGDVIVRRPSVARNALLNNTIIGEVGAGEGAHIMNNIIVHSGDCLEENSIDSTSLISNNNLHCDTAYEGRSVEDLNTESWAADNINTAFLFADAAAGNYSLPRSITTPIELVEGGLNAEILGLLYAEDKTGTPRTAPWTIGAYELDLSIPLDDYEFDNTLANAARISDIETQSRSLSFSDDVDWIQVVDNDYTMTVEEAHGLDIVLELFDEIGNLIETINNNGIGGDESVLVENGHYLRISSDGTTAGTYNLRPSYLDLGTQAFSAPSSTTRITEGLLQAELTWNHLLGALEYEIHASDVPNFSPETGTLRATVSRLEALNFLDIFPGLGQQTRYYRVRAMNPDSTLTSLEVAYTAPRMYTSWVTKSVEITEATDSFSITIPLLDVGDGEFPVLIYLAGDFGDANEYTSISAGDCHFGDYTHQRTTDYNFNTPAMNIASSEKFDFDMLAENCGSTGSELTFTFNLSDAVDEVNNYNFIARAEVYYETLRRY